MTIFIVHAFLQSLNLFQASFKCYSNFFSVFLQFAKLTTLPGHEDWVRGLHFTVDGKASLMYFSIVMRQKKSE